MKNTEYVYGIVVFTGHETKIMKNQVQAKSKLSKLERSLNLYMIFVVLLQITVAFVSAGFGIFDEYLEVQPYFGAIKRKYPGIISIEFWSKFGSFFGSWFILFLNIVPISMLVTLEGVKFFQAVMIQNDWMIYDVDKDMPTRAQSSNLNEELGTVHFVFSDKTGTLTQNIMEFKKFSAGSLTYGKSDP